MSPETSSPSFRQFADTLPQIVWTAGPDGVMDYANRRLYELTGLPEGQAPAASARGDLVEGIHPEDRRRCLELWRQSLRAGEPFFFECRCRHREDAPWRWYRLRALPERDESGAIRRWYGTAADIQNQREMTDRLREGENALAAMQALTGAGACRWEIRTGKIEWDATLHRMFGLPPGGGPGTFAQFVQLVHPADRVTVTRHCGHCASTGADFDLEFRIVRPDQSVRLIHGLGRTLMDERGRPFLMIAACLDLTESRRRAERAAAAQDRLRAEIRALREEALQTTRERDAFLSALSHELRSPLNPALLLAGEAADNFNLPPTVRADFSAIRANVETAARLIDDLQDLARVSRGRLRLDYARLDLHAALEEILTSLQPALKRKNLRLIRRLHPAPLWVHADPARLRRILRAALENVAASAAAGMEVSVRTQPPGERGRATLSIMAFDSLGEGEAEPTPVFDILPQSVLSAADHDHEDPAAAHGHGHGLSLAVACLLAELHGGSLRASSHAPAFRLRLPATTDAPDEGESETSTPPAPAPSQLKPAPGFRFSFQQPPVSATAEPSSGGGARTPLPPDRRRVLLVEDHEPTRAALERLLRRRRCTVASAGTLAEARVLAKTQEFDFVVSDIGLPDGSGNDLMKELRQTYGLRGIAMTGYGMEQDIQRSRDAGFLYHLTKPVSVQSLDSALTGICAQTAASKTSEA